MNGVVKGERVTSDCARVVLSPSRERGDRGDLTQLPQGLLSQPARPEESTHTHQTQEEHRWDTHTHTHIACTTPSRCCMIYLVYWETFWSLLNLKHNFCKVESFDGCANKVLAERAERNLTVDIVFRESVIFSFICLVMSLIIIADAVTQLYWNWYELPALTRTASAVELCCLTLILLSLLPALSFLILLSFSTHLIFLLSFSQPV